MALVLAVALWITRGERVASDDDDVPLSAMSRRSAGRRAILDLPGMVGDVPRGAADEVAGWEAAVRFPRAAPQRFHDARPQVGHATLAPLTRRHADADLHRICALRVRDVLDDGIAVAPSASAALAQVGGSGGHHGVQRGPARLEQ